MYVCMYTCTHSHLSGYSRSYSSRGRNGSIVVGEEVIAVAVVIGVILVLLLHNSPLKTSTMEIFIFTSVLNEEQ